MKIKKNKTIQNTISQLMILLLLTPAGAYAADFDMTCEKPLRLAEQVKAKGCKSNPTSSDCVSINKNLKGMGGDQILAYCMQADLARKTRNWERAKTVLYGAASATCFAIALNIWGMGTQEAACTFINYGAAGAGAGLDLTGKGVVRSKSKEYAEQCDQIGKTNWGQWKNLAITATAAAPLVATQAIKALNTSPKGGCIICGTSMAIVAGISGDSWDSAAKSMNASILDAESVKTALDESVTEIGGGSNSIKKNDTSVVQSSPTTPMQNNDSEDCSSPDVKGDHYMSCISKQVPEIAAITGNPAAMKAFSKALKGKNLGDFIKGFDGKEDVKDYVAKGMGMSPELFKGLSNMSEPFAKKIGLSIQPQSGSSGFAKVGGASAGGKGDYEYGSKAAAGVASNLNDASLGAEKEVTALDPADALFRQLDLLSPDQIESNPKISLFVRAAYRYRKNINNVEKLNSAIEERVPATNKR